MIRSSGKLAHILLLTGAAAIVGCGGGKKVVKKPVVEEEEEAPPPKKETEEDREAKRRAQALELVPDGSTCLPAALKEEGGPALELAAIGADAVVCATDVNPERLLGPVACWTVNTADSSLTYRSPAPMPGRGYSVLMHEGCARGFCVPKAKGNGTAHMVWSPDGSKVAVQTGDDLHLFTVEGKAHESSFPIRGDKGVSNTPTAVHWVGDTLFVEGRDDGPASMVWAFKADGTALGAVQPMGAKDPTAVVNTHGGAVSILDANRVGVAERGYGTVTIVEVDSGKRSKLVRKPPKLACKPAEIEAYWTGGETPAKCKEGLDKGYGPFVGATSVMGKTSMVTLLRGARIGEIAVLDAKTLAEKKVIKLPWCAAEGGGDGGGEAATDAAQGDE